MGESDDVDERANSGMVTKPGVPLGKNVPQVTTTHYKQEKAESVSSPPRRIKHEATTDPREDPQMRTPKSDTKTREDRGRKQEKPHRVRAGAKGARRLAPESIKKLVQRQLRKRIKATMTTGPMSLQAEDSRSSQIRTSSVGGHPSHIKKGAFDKLMKKLIKSEMRMLRKQKLQKMQESKENKLRKNNNKINNNGDTQRSDAAPWVSRGSKLKCEGAPSQPTIRRPAEEGEMPKHLFHDPHLND